MFSGYVAAGLTPPTGMYRALIAAARVTGMLEDPAVITASQWQDWLHPRGKDGKFIQKDSFVNIFADPAAGVTDRTAKRRRAKIVELRPEGAFVEYYDATKPDAKGRATKVPADPKAGFPELIPVTDLADKVSSAPQAIAHLNPALSAHDEHQANHVPAMTQAEYAAEIDRVNQVNRAAYAEQAKIVASGQSEISDQEFIDHAAFIAQVNHQVAFRPGKADPVTGDTPMAAGQSLTYDAAFKDSYGMWSDEIQDVFDNLVDEVFNEVTENQTKPKNKRAIMLGGLPGAGKSSTLDAMREAKVFNGSDWIVVNPDHFKDVMLDKGLYPKIEGLAPAETASFIHEASSEMNHMLEQLLTAEGYNIIFDVTMGGSVREGEKTWTEKHVESLTVREYTTDGIFVDVLPATSRSRVEARHKAGLNALRTQIPPVDRKNRPNPNDPSLKYGGRTVPDAVISENELAADDPNAGTFNSLPAVNFNQVKASFQRWAVYDNNGGTPVFAGGSAAGEDDRENMPGFYRTSTPDAAAPGEEDLL